MLQGQQNSIIYPGSVQTAAPFGTTPTGYGYGSFTAVYNSGAAPSLPQASEPALAINGNIGGRALPFNFYNVFFDIVYHKSSKNDVVGCIVSYSS